MVKLKLSFFCSKKTAFGRRLLYSWITKPLMRMEAIDSRLDAVQVRCDFKFIYMYIHLQLCIYNEGSNLWAKQAGNVFCPFSHTTTFGMHRTLFLNRYFN